MGKKDFFSFPPITPFEKRMADNDYVSAEILAQHLAEQEKMKRKANADLTKLKEDLNISQLNKRIKELKEELYLVMVEDDIEKVDKYSREKLIPAAEKKQLREKSKREAIQSVLEQEIRNKQKLDSLVNGVVESLTKTKI